MAKPPEVPVSCAAAPQASASGVVAEAGNSNINPAAFCPFANAAANGNSSG